MTHLFLGRNFRYKILEETVVNTRVPRSVLLHHVSTTAFSSWFTIANCEHKFFVKRFFSKKTDLDTVVPWTGFNFGAKTRLLGAKLSDYKV
jgi:hypothetical protein